MWWGRVGGRWSSCTIFSLKADRCLEKWTDDYESQGLYIRLSPKGCLPKAAADGPKTHVDRGKDLELLECEVKSSPQLCPAEGCVLAQARGSVFKWLKCLHFHWPGLSSLLQSVLHTKARRTFSNVTLSMSCNLLSAWNLPMFFQECQHSSLVPMWFTLQLHLPRISLPFALHSL